MTLREVIAEYAVPSVIGAGVYVVRRMALTILNFKRDITKEFRSLNERIGTIETRMVHLEGAVHQNMNSNPPPKPRRFISER